MLLISILSLFSLLELKLKRYYLLPNLAQHKILPRLRFILQSANKIYQGYFAFLIEATINVWYFCFVAPN
jgi:hypothetical protein